MEDRKLIGGWDAYAVDTYGTAWSRMKPEAGRYAGIALIDSWYKLEPIIRDGQVMVDLY